MTITLHWWAVPILILVVGIILAIWAGSRSSSPIDPFPGVIFIIFSFGALCTLLGHWL